MRPSGKDNEQYGLFPFILKHYSNEFHPWSFLTCSQVPFDLPFPSLHPSHLDDLIVCLLGTTIAKQPLRNSVCPVSLVFQQFCRGDGEERPSDSPLLKLLSLEDCYSGVLSGRTFFLRILAPHPNPNQLLWKVLLELESFFGWLSGPKVFLKWLSSSYRIFCASSKNVGRKMITTLLGWVLWDKTTRLSLAVYKRGKNTLVYGWSFYYRERLERKKYIDFLNVSFMWHGKFIRKERSKKPVKTVYFCAALDEE